MINFSTSNDGQWFEFDPGNPQLGRICVRGLSLDEAKRIDKMCTKSKRKFKRGQLITVTDIDEDRRMKLTFDYCIVKWENVSIDGKLAECNMANKSKLMNSNDFVKLVSDFIEEVNDSNQALEEAREKNSETISNGDSQS